MKKWKTKADGTLLGAVAIERGIFKRCFVLIITVCQRFATIDSFIFRNRNGVSTRKEWGKS